jgi:transcriptional regulatory protein LevR
MKVLKIQNFINMLLETKKDSPIDIVEVYHHIKCMIVRIDRKNNLYEFNEADKMIRDLSVFVNKDELERVKDYFKVNCTKVKFTEASEPPEQLSLF